MARAPKTKPEETAKPAPAKPTIVLAPKKAGRPRSLNPDVATLKTVFALGRVSATMKDVAHALQVSEPTFLKFKAEFPEVQRAYDEGAASGRSSLRAAQYRAAMAGNSTMMVWLGKQWLGQADKQQTELSGPGGAPLEVNTKTVFIIHDNGRGYPDEGN